MKKSVIASVLLALAAHTAYAQPTDVAGQIKFLETQPGDMDRSAWKEKRRDVARKLGQAKEKKAIPALIKLADTETFDIVGEISIEALGNIGDPSASAVLTKIMNDTTRDKAVRELAKKALGKLKGTAAPTPPTPTPPTPTPPTPTPPTPTPPTPTPPTPVDPIEPTGLEPTPPVEPTPPTTGLLGERPAVAVPAGPTLEPDTLAAWERLTFSAGAASVSYDTIRKRAAFDLDVAGTWGRRVERERIAYGWNTGAHVVAAYLNPPERAKARMVQVNLTADGEARFYAGKIYGVGKAAAAVQINNLSNTDDDNADQDTSDTRLNADLQIAIGGGYGRLLDVGGAIRVRRLSRTLDAARALGKPIDAATAQRLQLAWWGLRGERSLYQALVTTVAILREAGILLGEPDAGLSFEILSVLRDTQLFLRPSGLDVQIAIGEGYLRRPAVQEGESPAAGEAGRVEQLLVQAGYAQQLADDTLELSGGLRGRYRLFAPETPPQPSPWALEVGARARKFTYGEHGDAFGALDLSASILLSDDDPLNDMDSELGMRFESEVGFTYVINQASGLRLAGQLALDGGELFFGATLEATYGLLTGTFAGL